MDRTFLDDLLPDVFEEEPSFPTGECLDMQSVLVLAERPRDVPKKDRHHFLECSYCRRQVALARRYRDIIGASPPGDPISSGTATPSSGDDGVATFYDLLASVTYQDEPDLERIGGVLRTIADRLPKQEHNRRRLFQSCIRTVIDSFPGRDTWHTDLIRQAHRRKWPQWAVETLPCLYVRLRSGSVYLWRHIVACIPESYQLKIEKKLARGLVLKVSLGETAAKWVKEHGTRFEEARLSNDLPTNRSMINATLQFLLGLQQQLEEEGRSHEAQSVKAYREQLPNKAFTCDENLTCV